MNPDIGRHYKRRLIFILILAVPIGVLLFFYRMYNDDIRAIKDFVAAYERFDQGVSDLGKGPADDFKKVDRAVTDLGAKAKLRLSSLIRNDAGLMAQALEVVDLSRRELDRLRAYDAWLENQTRDPAAALKKDELASECVLLRVQRKAVFGRFQEFEGIR